MVPFAWNSLPTGFVVSKPHCKLGVQTNDEAGSDDDEADDESVPSAVGREVERRRRAAAAELLPLLEPTGRREDDARGGTRRSGRESGAATIRRGRTLNCWRVSRVGGKGRVEVVVVGKAARRIEAQTRTFEENASTGRSEDRPTAHELVQDS